jgi:hypothetical protein
MNDKKIRFYIRVSASVLAELKTRAKQQGVPVQDLARYCLERSLAITSMEEIRNELIEATRGLVSASGNGSRQSQATTDSSFRVALKSILFIENYLRSLALKEPDPVSVAERISVKKFKELTL